jgi:hypothetical protein
MNELTANMPPHHHLTINTAMSLQANEAGDQIVTEGAYEVFFKGTNEDLDKLKVPIRVRGPARLVTPFAM